MGLPINIINAGWSLLIIAMYLSPLHVLIAPENISRMNWSCIIDRATVIFAGLHWLISARHRYLKFSNSVLEVNVIVVENERRTAVEFVK